MRKLTAVLVGLAFHGTPCATQTTGAEAFARWGSQNAVPLGNVGLAAPLADLGPLRPMIGATRLVMLGEPLHGAHQPLAFRNRLFRFLVEEAGFTAIAMETGLPESHALQAYIDGGRGDVRAIARQSFTWRFGEFEENVELLQWMRAYNSNPRTQRRLHLYGVDLSGSDEDTAATRLRNAIAPALTWLRRADSGATTHIEASFAPAIRGLQSGPHEALPTDVRNSLTAAIADLIAELERNRASMLAESDRRAADFAMRSAVVARQLDAFWRAMPAPGNFNGIPPGVWRPLTARDGAMADNVGWALAQEGADGKLLVFAHNSHVMNSVLTGGSTRSLAVPPTMMGKYLNRAFDGKLFVIGITARNPMPEFGPAISEAGGVDATVAQVASRHFLLNLRSAPTAGAVAEWLRTPHSLRVGAAQQVDVAPGQAFDALVLVDSLTRANRN